MIETAIKKAIEGGYIYTKEYTQESMDFLVKTFVAHQWQILYDPLFWQALGKAEGWSADPESGHYWLEQWHHFIDHIASGKSVDSFFEELLSANANKNV